MLKELHISNFAVIEEQHISFGPGLNVISGETGSGKSIILQALGLLLGSRVRSDFFRAESDGWELEALFDLSGYNAAFLEQLPEIARSAELLISRSQTRSGRGKIMINGRLGSLALIQEIGQLLIESCSHSESLRLTSAGYQLALIDRFSGLQELKSRYLQIYLRWRDLREKSTLAQSAEQRSAQRKSDLEFSIKELEAQQLKPGGKAELERKISSLANAERILEHGRSLQGALDGSGAALEQLSSAAHEFRKLEAMDRSFAQMGERFHGALEELTDFSSQLERVLSGIDLDQGGLEEYRARLSEIARLERKYQIDEQGLVALLQRMKSEYELLFEERGLQQLLKELEDARGQLETCAKLLSEARLAGLKKIVGKIETELSELNMPGVKLGYRHEVISPEESGADRIELLFSANKGEELKPISQIASAGELSRIMLVLKKVLGNFGSITVLIFDEIDSGVSGAVARVMGEKLRAISEHSQVICITHLPQVASLAERHFLVSKQSSSKRTISVVKELSGSEQVEEIARMLAGRKVTKASLASAKELLSTN